MRSLVHFLMLNFDYHNIISVYYHRSVSVNKLHFYLIFHFFIALGGLMS